MTFTNILSRISSLLFGLVIIVCGHTLQAWAADFNSAPTVATGETSPSSAVAESEFKQESSDRWSREWLESRGMSFEVTYRSEVFTNLHGGTDGQRGGEYLGSADASVTLNLAKMGLARGSVVLTGQSLHGRGINDRKVGAIQAPSNLNEAAFNKLVEVYFTDSLFHERVTFKAGRLYADADFNAVETAGDFLNASYGLIPTILMPTYPTPQVGASVWTTINSRVSIGAGVYGGGNLQAPGEDTSPISAGLFTIVEAKVEPFSKLSMIRGSYHFGVWQQGNGTWKAGDALAPARNYGVYATGEHWFGKPLSSGSNVGPGVFFQAGWSPADRNEVSKYWGAGVAYAGMLQRREHDSVGVGVTQARLETGSETVLEVFYRFQATKKVFVQPDLQWVTKPYGNGPSALLGGLRLGIAF